MKRKILLLVAVVMLMALATPVIAQTGTPAQPMRGLVMVGRWITYGCGQVLRFFGAPVNPDDAFRW